jgi:hypothetical protein
VTHLHAEELLDVAEGSRAAGEFPHLQSCAACAREIAGLRAVIGAAADVSVPDPSPLFWDHLSARVRKAIASEEGPVAGRGTWLSTAWWRIAAATAVIVLAVVVGSTMRRAAAPPVSTANRSADATGTGAASVDLLRSDEVEAFDEDPALALLADLTPEMDWETAAEAGLVPADGAVDRVVFALSAEERVELHRLLQEALAGAGA